MIRRYQVIIHRDFSKESIVLFSPRTVNRYWTKARKQYSNRGRNKADKYCNNPLQSTSCSQTQKLRDRRRPRVESRGHRRDSEATIRRWSGFEISCHGGGRVLSVRHVSYTICYSRRRGTIGDIRSSSYRRHTCVRSQFGCGFCRGETGTAAICVLTTPFHIIAIFGPEVDIIDSEVVAWDIGIAFKSDYGAAVGDFLAVPVLLNHLNQCFIHVWKVPIWG